MLIQPVNPMSPTICNYTIRDLQRGFKENWDMEVSSRNITRLITRLDKDRVIKRRIYAYNLGKYGTRAQANKYEIIDPDKGFKDLLEPS